MRYMLRGSMMKCVKIPAPNSSNHRSHREDIFKNDSWLSQLVVSLETRSRQSTHAKSVSLMIFMSMSVAVSTVRTFLCTVVSWHDSFYSVG